MIISLLKTSCIHIHGSLKTNDFGFGCVAQRKDHPNEFCYGFTFLFLWSAVHIGYVVLKGDRVS